MLDASLLSAITLCQPATCGASTTLLPLPGCAVSNVTTDSGCLHLAISGL
jgi:hypothetical protein